MFNPTKMEPTLEWLNKAREAEGTAWEASQPTHSPDDWQRRGGRLSLHKAIQNAISTHPFVVLEGRISELEKRVAQLSGQITNLSKASAA